MQMRQRLERKLCWLWQQCLMWNLSAWSTMITWREALIWWILCQLVLRKGLKRSDGHLMLTSSSSIQWEPKPEPFISKWTRRICPISSSPGNSAKSWWHPSWLCKWRSQSVFQKILWARWSVQLVLMMTVPAKKKTTLLSNRESVPNAWTLLLILNETVSTTGYSHNARSMEISHAQPMKSTVI